MLYLVDDTGPLDDPAEYDHLSSGERACLDAWIAHAIRPARRVYTKATSYGLKHTFEAGSSIYVTNGAFKGAMQAAGHIPVDPARQNWQFRISLFKPKPRKPSGPPPAPDKPCIGCGTRRFIWWAEYQRWYCRGCDLWALPALPASCLRCGGDAWDVQKFAFYVACVGCGYEPWPPIKQPRRRTTK